MKENEMKKKLFPVQLGLRGKLAALALLAVGVGAAAAALTGAWYASNRQTGQEALKITSDTTEISLLDFRVYRGVLSTGEDGKPVVTPEIADTSKGAAAMNNFDSVIGNNEDTAVFFRLTISGEKVKAKEPITVTVDCKETDRKAASLSNIVTLQVAPLTAGNVETLGTATDAETVYNACKSMTWGDKKSFFTDIPKPAGRYTAFASDTKKNTEVTFTVSDYALVGEEDDESAVIFLRVDYDQGLVEAYLNAHSNNISGRLNKTVTEKFGDDIEKIGLSVG
jgi:hypothetical protein